MAVEIRAFANVIPPATAINSGFALDMSFPARIVNEIEIRVPPGPAGNVGFSIGSAGAPVIPANNGLWMITDDEVINWVLQDYINSGSWTFFGYNLGKYQHTIYVRFLLSLIGTADTSLIVPVSPSVLSS